MCKSLARGTIPHYIDTMGLTAVRLACVFKNGNACSHSTQGNGIFLPYSPRRTGCEEYSPYVFNSILVNW
jgi:hypothetical protein